MSNPSAYKGDLPYVFISYAHKDESIVFPIIDRLQQDGFRVWYDEGIVPGSNWDVYISEQLDRCSNVLCFISKAYIKSQNCKDELALARIKRKSMYKRDRKPVDSSNLVSIGYDASQQILEVEFKNGRVFQYTHFPEEMWFEFEAAPSKGKYFASQIRPRFEDLGYRVE